MELSHETLATLYIVNYKTRNNSCLSCEVKFEVRSYETEYEFCLSCKVKYDRVVGVMK